VDDVGCVVVGGVVGVVFFCVVVGGYVGVVSGFGYFG